METALSEAIKTFRPQTKRYKPHIRVCDDCAAPLIWTFFIPYCERYCLNCGAAGGMLGTGTDVELTKELKLQNAIIQSVFKVLRKKKLPLGKFGRTNCKHGRPHSSCDDHRSHLTKSEIEWDEIASRYLKHFNQRGLIPKP